MVTAIKFNDFFESTVLNILFIIHVNLSFLITADTCQNCDKCDKGFKLYK